MRGDSSDSSVEFHPKKYSIKEQILIIPVIIYTVYTSLKVCNLNLVKPVVCTELYVVVFCRRRKSSWP